MVVLKKLDSLKIEKNTIFGWPKKGKHTRSVVLMPLIKVNLLANHIMNTNVILNDFKIKPSLLLLPLFCLITIVLWLYHYGALTAGNYVQIQKNYFFFINSKLSVFPNTLYNLTQFGDALIFLSFLTILLVYAPKIWEALLSASLVSALFSKVLKTLFAIPRPAAVFDNHSFVIIGKTLNGHNSLPSGHSITIFTLLTVLIFAGMPQKLSAKIGWCLFMVLLGFILAFTRVGVGAHYPLDVIIGSIVGYISGIFGLYLSKKYNLWTWIGQKKYYPILMVLLLICCCALIVKIGNENLIIYDLCLISLIVSLYKITRVYVQK